jgi:HK97 gp10 family phage protein
MSDAAVKGLRELQAALDALPAKIEANIMRAAMRAGAKVVAAEARSLVPERSGRLAESVRYGAKLSAKAGQVQAYVRAGGKGRKGGKTVRYAHLVEYGTAAHVIRAGPGKRLPIGGGFATSVQHPGAKKHPFMRPAADASAQAALQAVGDYIRNRLRTKHGIDVPAPPDPQAEDE